MRVDVIYAEVARVWRCRLELPAEATVGEALGSAADQMSSWPLAAREANRLAVFGRDVEASYRLKDGDRLELLRPLLCDPKDARRQRARQGPAPGR